MQQYQNKNGNSGILAYEIGKDYIDVAFREYGIYRYSYTSTGEKRVEQMKQLAIQGYGLNSYISRYVKKDYEKKILII